MTATTPPPLPADLNDGLRRLKMAAMRRLAPELLITAKTQRWNPEEFLRTLIEAEIASRDESNARTRMRQATFPVTKTLTEFDVAASSIPPATFAYLSSLEWIRATENVCMIGPAGTGKSHTLIGVGIAAVQAGHRVRYFTAAELVETLYRGLADNSVGRVIDTLLRNDVVLVDELGFAPLDDTAAQLLFRFVAAAYERRSLGIASHWPFESWGTIPARTHHRGQHARPAPTPLPHRRHRRRLLPHEASPSQRRNPTQHQLKPTRGGDYQLATTGDHNLAIDTGEPAHVAPAVRVLHPSRRTVCSATYWSHRGAIMSDKSPRQHMAKKQGKTIKEKRADKRDKANAAASIDPVSRAAKR